MTPFNQASYLAQVRRLRKLAMNALVRFPVRVRALHFIHHGENTTFQVVSESGKKFLLRIHRDGYHTKGAILEELKWLAHLAKEKSFLIPIPVPSKTNKQVETVSVESVPRARFVCLFQWIDGHFIDKSIQPRHLFEVGRTLGRLQNCTPKSQVRHRRYWTAQGLVGKMTKFGSIEALSGVWTPTTKKFYRF